MPTEIKRGGPVVRTLQKTIEGFGSWWSSIKKTSMQNYVDIEMVDDDETLVASDFSMVSGLELRGVLSVVGGQEFETLLYMTNSVLSSVLREPGVTIELTFMRDPSTSGSVLENVVAPNRRTAKYLKLDADDLLDSRVKHLSRYISDERCYLAIWSSPDAVPPTELKNNQKDRHQAVKNLPPIAKDKQEISLGLQAIRERHQSVVASIAAGLKDAGLLVEKMSAREMLRASRYCACPEWTPENWQPTLPGDKMPAIEKQYGDPYRDKLDIFDLMYPSLGSQIMPRDAYRLGKTVEVGDYVYAPIAMEIPPRTVLSFPALFSKMRDGNIPYRISFRIQGGAMKYTTMKRVAASFLAWTKGHNGKIRDTVEALEEIANDESVCRYAIAMTTWAPKDDDALLTSRRNRMIQFFQGWGDMEVRETTGDPLELFTDCLPFVRREPVSNFGIAPLHDILTMLPLSRPASPWSTGAVLYRSIDGKLLPFDIGSSKQDTWAYLFIAMPGSGKSVSLANMLLGSTMEDGLRRLPRISIIDIGPSSSGLINMLRDILPPHQQHLVSHFRMQMTRDYCINIMDTQVTCRYPTSEHRQMLISFLTELATPPEKTDGPYPSMSQLAAKVVDELYKMFSDTTQGNPKAYRPRTSVEVDYKLAEIGFTPNIETTWWEVVDTLFNAGHIHEATLAQRFAVPVLSDSVQAVREPSVRDLYQVKLADTGEMIYEAFSRLVSDATRDYCVLAEPTRFDIGQVRIAAIDVEPVAKSGSASANKQTALMYMLAKYALTKDYRLTEESIKQVAPAHSLKYHLKRCQEILGDKKWVVMDEFHRTAKATSVRDDVLVDIREGRKWRTGIILASQGADDFPTEIINFTTGRFILKAGDPAIARAMQAKFGFNDSAREMLVKYCNGPTAEGAPFLAQLLTKSGMFTQLMYLTLAPVEAWAMSTTAADVVLRNKLSERLGRKEARARLGRAYPFSAQADIEYLKRQHSMSAAADDPNAPPFDAEQVVMDKILKAPPIYTTERIGSVTNGLAEQILAAEKEAAQLKEAENSEEEEKEEG